MEQGVQIMKQKFEFTDETFNMPKKTFIHGYFGVSYAYIIQQWLYFQPEEFKEIYLEVADLELFSLLNNDRNRLSILHIVISYFIDSEEEYKHFFSESSFKEAKKELTRFLDVSIEDNRVKLEKMDETNYVDIGNYLIKQNLSSIRNRAINATFQVLFNDRFFLQHFSVLFSEWLGIKLEEDVNLLKDIREKENTLKRKSSFPEWIKHAVYFRDRGICSLCQNKLLPTGLKSGLDKAIYEANVRPEFDHIVPITKQGTNDITNLQLLCSSCNNSKGNRNSNSSDFHVPFYDYFENYDEEFEKLNVGNGSILNVNQK